MFAKLTGTLAAAAIALTSMGAAPAQADDRDAARIAAALLGIAIVGKIIHDNKKDRKAAKRDKWVRPDTRPDRTHRPRGVKPRPLPPRVDRRNTRLLPQNCFQSFETYEGPRHIFGRKCLQRNYRYADSLPARCQVNIRAGGKVRHGYGARCLRREGYELARN